MSIFRLCLFRYKKFRECVFWFFWVFGPNKNICQIKTILFLTRIFYAKGCKTIEHPRLSTLPSTHHTTTPFSFPKYHCHSLHYEGRTSDESTTSRQGRRATKRVAPASDVTVGVSPWVWFALGLGFGFLCIGLVFFCLVDKQICIAVLGNGVWFGLLLLCMDCIWFSLPTTWPWIDFWFALYWFFFFLFFGWESMGLLPPDYVGLGLLWAVGLALLPKFFFFFRF